MTRRQWETGAPDTRDAEANLNDPTQESWELLREHLGLAEAYEE